MNNENRKSESGHELVEVVADQASKIIKKLGGYGRTSRLLGVARSTVYRWTWPRSAGGTGGIIPPKMLPSLILAARRDGILLSPQDLYPEPSIHESEHHS